MPPIHIAYAALVALIWGLNFVAFKMALADFPPLLLMAVRFALASLPFLPFLRSPGVAWKWVIGIGLSMGALQFGLLLTATQWGMPPGLTSTAIQTQAFFTVILAIVFLGERPGWRNIAGLVLAAGGILVIAGHLGSVPILPFLMTLGAAFCWGISNVLTRKAKAPDPFRLIVWACAVAPIPLLLMSWVTEGEARIAQAFVAPSWLTVGAIAFIVFPATTFAWGLWNFLLGKYSAASVVPYGLLVPFFGIASSWLILGEKPEPAKLIGAALIIAGVGVNSFSARRAVPAPRTAE